MVVDSGGGYLRKYPIEFKQLHNQCYLIDSLHHDCGGCDVERNFPETYLILLADPGKATVQFQVLVAMRNIDWP